ncbi:MAG: hypothetical protein ACYDDF_11350 [Thermoplasmatota archaeon]
MFAVTLVSVPMILFGGVVCFASATAGNWSTPNLVDGAAGAFFSGLCMVIAGILALVGVTLGRPGMLLAASPLAALGWLFLGFDPAAFVGPIGAATYATFALAMKRAVSRLGAKFAVAYAAIVAAILVISVAGTAPDWVRGDFHAPFEAFAGLAILWLAAIMAATASFLVARKTSERPDAHHEAITPEVLTHPARAWVSLSLGIIVGTSAALAAEPRLFPTLEPVVPYLLLAIASGVLCAIGATRIWPQRLATATVVALAALMMGLVGIAYSLAAPPCLPDAGGSNNCAGYDYAAAVLTALSVWLLFWGAAAGGTVGLTILRSRAKGARVHRSES